MWIESHQDIWNHPKTRKLEKRLGISRAAAVGHLHGLWHWAVSYALDGSLTRHEPEDIAIAAYWDGDPNDLLTALRDTGWIDDNAGELSLHDWDQYTGRLIERRERDAERKRAAREAMRARLADVHAASDERPEDGVRTNPPTNQPDLPTSPTTPALPEDVEVGKRVKRVRRTLSEEGFTEEELERPLRDLANELATNPGHINSPVGWTRARALKERAHNTPSSNVAVIDGEKFFKAENGEWVPADVAHAS
jgi:hypothetical protein